MKFLIVVVILVASSFIESKYEDSELLFSIFQQNFENC